MFVWRDFRNDGKLRREKWRENFLMGVWLEEEGKKIWWDPSVFSPVPPKYLSSQNGEKT